MRQSVSKEDWDQMKLNELALDELGRLALDELGRLGRLALDELGRLALMNWEGWH